MIENERKYIIDISYKDALTACNNYIGVVYDIQQAYVKDGRIRKIQKIRPDFDRPEYIFTWKVRRSDWSMIEIETPISQRDFQELWNMAKITILKRRIKIFYCGVTWDIDFLEKYDISKETGGMHYLTIAEAEMPEGWDEPTELPDFVKDNLLWLVPRDKDKDWSNKNLSNPVKVKQMLANVLANKE